LSLEWLEPENPIAEIYALNCYELVLAPSLVRAIIILSNGFIASGV
jgi:hypothetical protein